MQIWLVLVSLEAFLAGFMTVYTNVRTLSLGVCVQCGRLYLQQADLNSHTISAGFGYALSIAQRSNQTSQNCSRTLGLSARDTRSPEGWMSIWLSITCKCGLVFWPTRVTWCERDERFQTRAACRRHYSCEETDSSFKANRCTQQPSWLKLPTSAEVCCQF